ncbi:MAG: hypothetical protein RLZZ136_431 [Pseudomonadota bacterium]|jgi:hypothetical protein
MTFLKSDLFRAMGIGFALGCVGVIAVSLASTSSQSVVGSAIAAPAP